MKRFLFIVPIIFLFIFTISCDDDEPTKPPVEPTVSLDNPINSFVWKGMNSWYNWQTNTSNLADTKDDDLDAYHTYLNGFSSPEVLFESLLFDKGNTDRFSWFIDDYVVQNNQFQGISKSFGFRLQAVNINAQNDIIFYVRYVSNNSPAFNAGIKRGDIFNAIDGTTLNTTNYSNEAGKLSNESVTLSFVSESGGVLTPIGDKSITAVELADDPVYLKKVFTGVNGDKIGYLVYNGFRSSYNDELNAAFAFFKAEGIKELVLDLRLNGGGSVATSAYLASMIYNAAGTDKFADLDFNSKHSNQNGSYNFENTLNVYNATGNKTGEEAINRVNGVNRLYVLTSGSTASASEMIINGLKPFIPVKVIGTKTYGKNVGSITLYDSPSSEYTNISSANQNHKNAMQPIVFQIYNKNGESDYTQGFTPDIKVEEYQSWNNILAFGDANETVLKAALDDIGGVISKAPANIKAKKLNAIGLDMSSLENKFEKEMYIENVFLKE